MSEPFAGSLWTPPVAKQTIRFVWSGDTIYADGPLEAEKEMPNGEMWKNAVTEEKSKAAETLREFRGQYAYNLMDESLRRFNAERPMFAQWDDHEVTNNWSPTELHR